MPENPELGKIAQNTYFFHQMSAKVLARGLRFPDMSAKSRFFIMTPSLSQVADDFHFLNTPKNPLQMVPKEQGG